VAAKPSLVKYQFFPRSRPCPSHLALVVDAFRAIEPEMELYYADWLAGTKLRMSSNQVLKKLRPHLAELGYQVEGALEGKTIPMPVLWKENGVVEKTFAADALFRGEDGSETVVEVEAGGAVANNAWRKDLMEACLMPFVDYLAVSVRREYYSTDDKTGQTRINRDYDAVLRELGAIYASDHWKLPLKGILLIGY
jgi:hypothetical protein